MNFLCVSLRTFHRWDAKVFIMDDHDNFPSWMMLGFSTIKNNAE